MPDDHTLLRSMTEIRLMENGVTYADMAPQTTRKLLEWLSVVEVRDEMREQRTAIEEQDMKRRLSGFAVRAQR